MMKPNDNVANYLTKLEAMDRAALVAEWKATNKAPLPANMSRILMLRVLAYKFQEEIYGGLKKSVRDQLFRIVKSSDSNNAPLSQIKSGTRLLREWHGVTHEVVIGDDGPQYRGKTYRSLSDVAQVITGTKWSGPVFFGLRKKTK